MCDTFAEFVWNSVSSGDAQPKRRHSGIWRRQFFFRIFRFLGGSKNHANLWKTCFWRSIGHERLRNVLIQGWHIFTKSTLFLQIFWKIFRLSIFSVVGNFVRASSQRTQRYRKMFLSMSRLGFWDSRPHPPTHPRCPVTGHRLEKKMVPYLIKNYQ